jgi:hypothetical protein
MRRWISLIAVAVCAGGAAAQDLDPNDFWAAVRRTSPILVQDIVASPISPSGKAILVLTEPPSHAFAKADQIIRSAFGDLAVAENIQTQRIGYDGWVKDIVVTLRGVDGSKTWLLTKSKTARSTFGRSGSIKSKMSLHEPSLPSCIIPIVGS